MFISVCVEHLVHTDNTCKQRCLKSFWEVAASDLALPWYLVPYQLLPTAVVGTFELPPQITVLVTIVISTHKLLTSSPMLCMSCLWCWKLCIFIVKSMYKTLPLSEAVLMFTFIDNSCCGCWTRVVVHHYSFFVYLKTFTSPDLFCLCGACTLTAWLILIEETIDLWWV